MSLLLCCQQRLELRNLQIVGGTTETLFPRTEAKLNHSDYQKALQFIAKRKRGERYRSMMDFLFCEVFTEWRFPCFQFYNEKGPQLKDHPEVTQLMLAIWDMILCDRVLEYCMKALMNQYQASWKKMLEEVETTFTLGAVNG